MRTPQQHLIPPLAIHLPPHPRIQPVPLLISIPNIKLPNRQRQHDPNLQHRQLLPYAIPRSEIKRPPRAPDGIQRVIRPHEPALRQEDVGLYPLRGFTVRSLMHGPDHEARGQEVAALRVGDEEAGLAAAGAGRGGVEAQRLFDDGEGVGELVEEVRGRGDAGGGLGEVGAEDGVVLGAELGEGAGVRGEEVVGPADGAGGGVVAGEEEEFDLACGDGFEGGVHAFGGFVGGLFG